jgi:hypothetical protein
MLRQHRIPHRRRSASTARYITDRATPLTSSRQRLELIKIVAEAEHVALSTRIAALILLLYGTPVSKICELTLDDVNTTPARTTIRVGDLPAPIPQALLSLFHQHLDRRGNHRTMNHHSPLPALRPAVRHERRRTAVHALVVPKWSTTSSHLVW